MFRDPQSFPFVATLEARWRAVRAELDRLSGSRFVPWIETSLYGTGWDVFGFYAFGERDDAHCALCPETTKLVETIPRLVTAGFSSLKPGTVIKPHVGYAYSRGADGTPVTDRTLNSRVLRGHLGLMVPSTLTRIGCAIVVGDELRNWEEGRCIVFDDTVVHAAWNRGRSTRVVLLFDFEV